MQATKTSQQKLRSQRSSLSSLYGEFRIIIPPNLKGATKEQIDEMVNHTKELLLGARVISRTNKTQILINKCMMKDPHIEETKGNATPRETSHQA